MQSITLPAFACAISRSRRISCWLGIEAGGQQHSSPEKPPQLRFSGSEHALALDRQRFAGTVDVEIQHRHRRLERGPLAAAALLGRALERRGNASRTTGSEYSRLKIECVAGRCNTLRPPCERRCLTFSRHEISVLLREINRQALCHKTPWTKAHARVESSVLVHQRDGAEQTSEG